MTWISVERHCLVRVDVEHIVETDEQHWHSYQEQQLHSWPHTYAHTDMPSNISTSCHRHHRVNLLQNNTLHTYKSACQGCGLHVASLSQKQPQIIQLVHIHTSLLLLAQVNAKQSKVHRLPTRLHIHCVSENNVSLFIFTITFPNVNRFK